MSNISEAFLTKASEVLADTEKGISGPQIVKYMSDFAVDFGVDIPYASYPFPKTVANKRTALKENLKAFEPEEQFKVIVYFCELDKFDGNDAVEDLKQKLFAQYPELNVENHIVEEVIIEDTKHWLKNYPESLKLFHEATKKLELNIFQRNMIDDLRLSLEKLLCSILGNSKSLENQTSEIGKLIKDKNLSSQIQNMFVKILDYYAKYQNDHIKHNDKVSEEELEIIFEMTSSMMKFIVKIGNK